MVKRNQIVKTVKSIMNRLNYRTRAISGRSRLVAAPLRNHAKSQFLCVFLCDNLRAQKIIFEYKARPLMARVRYRMV